MLLGDSLVRAARLLNRKTRFRNVGAGKGVKALLDAPALRRLYVEEGLSQRDIASRYDCSRQYVSALLRAHGISRKKGSG